MMPKPKNIIIFILIAAVFVLVYVFFIKGSPEGDANLSSSVNVLAPDGSVSAPTAGAKISGDFLSLLLNVRTIKLNDAIFSDPAFTSLRDSSITLIPDGNEGRPNPFAPIGNNIVSPPSNVSTP